MGTLLSRPQCSALGATPDCTNIVQDADGHFTIIAGVAKGEFQGDPDIAGVGIVSTFIAVTGFALLVSLLNVIQQAYKLLQAKKRESDPGLASRTGRGWIDFSDLCESLVISCSDQQIFTGAAYAASLRYWAGCNISAYHYNIVCNMMLLTCATHLMSVTIVYDYWKYPLLAGVRIVVVTGVFLITGVFLSNQNVGGDKPFPSSVPALGTSDSLVFLPAICFQGDTSLTTTIGESLHTSGLSIGDKIHGWSNWLAMLFFYALALVAEAVRFVLRGQVRQGQRVKLGRWYRRRCGFLVRHEVAMTLAFLLYLLGGIGIASWTVALSVRFITEMRRWVKFSGWLEANERGETVEDGASSFGQLVPIS